MKILDHGTWIEYKPTELPPDVPRGAVFAKRESDGVDWYKYVHPGTNFQPDTVKFALDIRDGETIIRIPVIDADRLFPVGCRVVEIVDLKREQDEAKLIEEFANRRFDRKTGKIGEVWKPKQPPDTTGALLKEILKRLDKLEERK
jgi:hypothetical protein